MNSNFFGVLDTPCPSTKILTVLLRPVAIIEFQRADFVELRITHIVMRTRCRLIVMK